MIGGNKSAPPNMTRVVSAGAISSRCHPVFEPKLLVSAIGAIPEGSTGLLARFARL